MYLAESPKIPALDLKLDNLSKTDKGIIALY